MWTRKELKEKAKQALKRNYWKAVLVSLLIYILGGTGSGATGSSSVTYHVNQDEALTGVTTEEAVTQGTETFVMINSGSVTSVAEEVGDSVAEAVQAALTEFEQIDAAVFIALGVTICVVLLLFLAIAIAVDVFLVNPLIIGAERFMLKSVDGEGKIAELGFAFDHNYMNGVKAAFFRELYTFLWALLFIIPGIYKRYQYYMVDYILAENPDMPYREVLAYSTKMMDGQKWNAFVLDLSFILWHLLGTITCGLAEIFYVRPYKYLTRASLYRALCENQGE